MIQARRTSPDAPTMSMSVMVGVAARSDEVVEGCELLLGERTGRRLGHLGSVFWRSETPAAREPRS